MTRVNGLTPSPYQVLADRPGAPPLASKRPSTDAPNPRVRSRPAGSERQPSLGPGAGPHSRLDAQQLQELVAAINQRLREYAYPRHQVSLALKGEENDRFVVEVRDRQTEKVIMQFPPEALLDFGTKMREIVGVVVDQLS